MTNKLIGIILLTLTANVDAKLANHKPSSHTSSIKCMADNIFHEAGGESELGQKAVASVTMNRVLSPKFPKSVCGVVYQRGQFSWVGKKKAKRIPGTIIRLAKAYTEEYTKAHDVTNGSTHFNSSKNSRWTLKKTVRIGGHQFYKDDSRIVYNEAPGHTNSTIANK